MSVVSEDAHKDELQNLEAEHQKELGALKAAHETARNALKESPQTVSQNLNAMCEKNSEICKESRKLSKMTLTDWALCQWLFFLEASKFRNRRRRFFPL
jgi:predicted  nucleic acid-binding Zn-ribbon protein